MKLRYVWREIGDDGQLLDPDYDCNYPCLNTYGGHKTRESAIERYQKAYERDSWATPREFVLLEVYRVGF